MTVYASAGNVTTLDGLMRYSSMVSGGLFGLVLLIVIFSISFFAMRNAMGQFPGTNAKIFVASAFVTMVFSVMLFMIGVVNDVAMYTCVIATAVGMLASVISGGN